MCSMHYNSATNSIYMSLEGSKNYFVQDFNNTKKKLFDLKQMCMDSA